MIRLNLIAEGQTERAFASQVLIGHLAKCGVGLAKPSLPGKRKDKGPHGGLQRYQPFRDYVQRWLKQDKGGDVFFTTMVDLYRLPRTFPGYDEASLIADKYQRIQKLEAALNQDIADPRFIAYIQLHEFEALLFSDPHAFSGYYPHRERAVESLVGLAKKFPNPELIDDGETTAPSKQVRQSIPEYGSKAKWTIGPIIAATIGLDAIRAKCRHFNEWLTRLERLGSTQQT